MKALTLFLLRLSTGMLMVWWGLGRAVFNKNLGTSLSDRYYGGILNGQDIQVALGWAEVALGVVVILGFMRTISYSLQVLVLGGGALFIWKHLADPFGRYLFADGERANLLFFPSTTVAFATLVLLAFKEYDTLSLDGLRGR